MSEAAVRPVQKINSNGTENSPLNWDHIIYMNAQTPPFKA